MVTPAILDASFPEVLEVETEAQPDLFLAAFEYFLKGEKKPPQVMSDLSARDVNELRAAFAESVLSLLTPGPIPPGSASKVSRRRDV